MASVILTVGVEYEDGKRLGESVEIPVDSDGRGEIARRVGMIAQHAVNQILHDQYGDPIPSDLSVDNLLKPEVV